MNSEVAKWALEKAIAVVSAAKPGAMNVEDCAVRFARFIETGNFDDAATIRANAISASAVPTIAGNPSSSVSKPISNGQTFQSAAPVSSTP